MNKKLILKTKKIWIIFSVLRIGLLYNVIYINSVATFSAAVAWSENMYWTLKKKFGKEISTHTKKHFEG